LALDTTAIFEGTSMNKLALTTIMMTMLAAQAAGCVVHTRDRDGSGGGGGRDVAAISARWSLRNMADGATTLCPAGFDTVQLIAQAVDDAGNPVGDPAVDLFDCDSRTGESAGLTPDVYQVWIEVWSHDLGTMYAQSLSQVLDVRRLDQPFAVDILNDGGYFQLAWDLVEKTSNRPLECSQLASLGTIKLHSVSIVDARFAYDDELACEDHAGVTRGLLQGPYSIAIEATAGDMSVGKAATLMNRTIKGQNSITDLGLITIPIDGL
jgi:hypothetical protein